MTAVQHISFILNPTAGRGKARHIQAALQDGLAHSDLNYEFHLTAGPRDATSIARKVSTSSSIVVAVGGDGTVNEVASGLVGSNAALAVLSEGSGNDFGRLVNAPTRTKDIIKVLHQPEIKQFDSGKLRLTHNDGSISEHYFFNSVGLGFDAAVAYHVSTIQWLRGIPLYLTALLQTMIGYKPHYFIVQRGKEFWEREYFLLCIGNGNWEGGGFNLTPNALPDDGEFEVCGLSCSSIVRALPILPSVMTGKHIGKKYIESFNTDALVVESTNGFPVHGDGEIFGLQVKKAEISLFPKSLNVVVAHK